MNILVTGSAGFVGRNLVENLKALRDGRNATRPNIVIDDIFEYDRDDPIEALDAWCARADFVFNLAGANRPPHQAFFKRDNCDFAAHLLETLLRHKNRCPVMLSSSIQASLSGRFAGSVYGESKRAGEELFFRHMEETGAPVLVYRFPNLAGKWIRPEYNSAVGTFCHHIANDLPIAVNDPSVELELLFIDDLLEELYDALEGHPHRCDYAEDGMTPVENDRGRYCHAPITHRATVGEIVHMLHLFHDQPDTLMMPRLSPGSFEKKLYSMYLSYLPRQRIAYDLPSSIDARGSFTEVLKTMACGQFSVNVSKPGVTKGQHWHNSKWELFIVVSGRGLIQERKIGSDEVIEIEVSGERLQAVHMLPGYTHNIINLSQTENLVTLMWANEVFDKAHPDTLYEPVI